MMRSGLMGLLWTMTHPLEAMLRPMFAFEEFQGEEELMQQILGIGDAEQQTPWEDLDPSKQQVWIDAGKDAASFPYHKKKEESKPVEDPEFELEFGADDKKEKRKLKLSELKKGYMLNDDYTKKSQELAAEREKIKDLTDWAQGVKSNKTLSNIIMTITEKAFTDKGVNTEYLERILPAVSEKVEAEKEKLAVKSDEIEDVLKTLDEDSPAAKALNKIWAANQGQLKKLSDMEAKIAGIEKQHAARTDQETAKATEEAVSAAQHVLRSTLDEMLDPEKDGYLDIKSESMKGLWREMVYGRLSRNTGDIKTQADFVTAVREAGNAVYQRLQKMKEETLSSYIQTKKTRGPAGPKRTPDEVPAEDLSDIPSLQDGIEKALRDEEGRNQ